MPSLVVCSAYTIGAAASSHPALCHNQHPDTAPPPLSQLAGFRGGDRRSAGARAGLLCDGRRHPSSYLTYSDVGVLSFVSRRISPCTTRNYCRCDRPLKQANHPLRGEQGSAPLHEQVRIRPRLRAASADAHAMRTSNVHIAKLTPRKRRQA
ncbi:hypothetical protein BC834DRAFT_468921 [Gloeopeniophorella convolvens]|nr:hypothetical protein BC834DRAFT_468921 [Gloeopeniophorella convolvens]